MPWEYCRSEDQITSELEKKIKCLDNNSYDCIESISEHLDDLKQLRFKGVTLINDADQVAEESPEFIEVTVDDEVYASSDDDEQSTGYSLRERDDINYSELTCHHKLYPFTVKPGDQIICDMCNNKIGFKQEAWHCSKECDWDLCGTCCPPQRMMLDIENEENALNEPADCRVTS